MIGDAPAPQSILFLPDKSVRTGLSESELMETIRVHTGVVWLALAAADPASERLLKSLGFHPLAIEDCLNGHVDTPKVDDYGNYLFIVSQSVVYRSDDRRMELEELDLFLGPNFIVTVKPHNTMGSVDRLFLEASANPFLFNRGADFLAHTILDVIVDDILPAVEAMDESLDMLEQQIIERPEKAMLTDVLLLKRNTLRLRRAILPQRDMVNRLSRGEFGALISTEALIFYRDIYDHIVRIEAMLDSIRDLADSSLNSYLSALNNRMNEIMKALSVVAVIFLPLTLIASIFGTNLDYAPTGFTLHGGFYWMLAFMAVVTGAMIFFFRRRGWF